MKSLNRRQALLQFSPVTVRIRIRRWVRVVVIGMAVRRIATIMVSAIVSAVVSPTGVVRFLGRLIFRSGTATTPVSMASAVVVAVVVATIMAVAAIAIGIVVTTVIATIVILGSVLVGHLYVGIRFRLFVLHDGSGGQSHKTSQYNLYDKQRNIMFVKIWETLKENLFAINSPRISF